MSTCEKCSEYGLKFDRAYSPAQFLEGQPSSRVWIIGLNPKGDKDCVDDRTEKQLQQCLSDHARLHPYFHDFQKVSRAMYDMLGKDLGVAHTDLVKCYSPQWLPEAAANCKEYLQQQLLAKPVKVLVCNGAAVCSYIREIIPLTEDHDTYYYGEVNGRRVAVVLSGFIGRIDHYAQRRLGKEVESLLAKSGIGNKGG